jgi:hypothetical protein
MRCYTSTARRDLAAALRWALGRAGNRAREWALGAAVVVAILVYAVGETTRRGFLVGMATIFAAYTAFFLVDVGRHWFMAPYNRKRDRDADRASLESCLNDAEHRLAQPGRLKSHWSHLGSCEESLYRGEQKVRNETEIMRDLDERGLSTPEARKRNLRRLAEEVQRRGRNVSTALRKDGAEFGFDGQAGEFEPEFDLEDPPGPQELLVVLRGMRESLGSIRTRARQTWWPSD